MRGRAYATLSLLIADCIYVDFHSGKRYKLSRGSRLFEYRVNLQTKYRSNFCCARQRSQISPSARALTLALTIAIESNAFADYRPFQNAPLKRINIVTIRWPCRGVYSSRCTGVAAIVAGNYIGLTAGNKGKLRLKPPVRRERRGGKG